MMIDLQHYRRLVIKLAPSWKLLSQALCAQLIMAAAIASLPFFVKQMLESALTLKDTSLLQTATLAIITLFIVRGVAGYFSIRAIGKISEKLGSDLRMDFFNKLLALPAGCYAHFNPQQMDTLISHIAVIARNTTRSLALLLQDSLVIAGLMACALYLNREFAILFLLVAPLVVLIHQMSGNPFHHPGSKSFLAAANLIQHLSQSVRHYRKIRLDGGQIHESRRLGKISADLSAAETQHTMQEALVIPSSQVITALIMIAVAYVMALQVSNGALSLSEAGALIFVMLLLMLPLQRSVSLPRQLAQDGKALEALFSFLDQPSEQDTGTLEITQSYGKLTFEHVRFAADAHTKPILNHIHLTIRRGEVIVFTGYSDEEKNGLIDLILRLQQPTSGRILLNDQPLPDIRLNQLHAHIALVSPDTFLLDEKIAGNIAYGTMQCASEAKITAAAQASGAAAFIRHLPEGLQTKIGPEGTAIDQIQSLQLAIARAWVKNAPVLIVDELPLMPKPDSVPVLSALERLMQNRTTLIFNPQVPHLGKIDRIVVLKNGCLTENPESRNRDASEH